MHELRYNLQSTYKFVRENLIKSKEKSKEQFDKRINPKSFQVGDLVFIENSTNPKLGSKYDGPYQIKKIISDVNSRVKRKNNEKVIHNNRLKLHHEN